MLLALVNGTLDEVTTLVMLVLALGGAIFGIRYRTAYAVEIAAREAAESYGATQQARAEEDERALEEMDRKMTDLEKEMGILKQRDVTSLFEAFMKHDKFMAAHDETTREIAERVAGTLSEVSSALRKHMEKSERGEREIITSIQVLTSNLDGLTKAVQILAGQTAGKGVKPS